MKNEYKINLNPSELDLENIKNWLLDESEKYGEGFYSNWEIINKSFYNKELISFELDNQIVGFVVWTQDEKVIDIDIMEIHPDYRKCGLGKIFFQKIESVFHEKGNIAFVLFCEPRESEHFWRKQRFIKFPRRGWSESDLTFYKPLIKALEPIENPDENNKLELWNVEPFQSGQIEPQWSWNIEIEEGKLITPIIQPCNRNWNVRWTKNGKVIKDDKVKYFSRDYSIENGAFMYIEQLTE